MKEEDGTPLVVATRQSWISMRERQKSLVWILSSLPQEKKSSDLRGDPAPPPAKLVVIGLMRIWCRNQEEVLNKVKTEKVALET
jgi:hypothetical protein